MGKIDRTTPIGLFNFGYGFIESARILSESPKQSAFSGPFEFLCAHGLELIFKADIRRSREMAVIRKMYGHDLIKLWAQVSTDLKSRMFQTADFETVLSYLAQNHSSPFLNRYIVTGYLGSCPTVGAVIANLASISDSDRGWLLAHFGVPN
jgi:hypothetical protein